MLMATLCVLRSGLPDASGESRPLKPCHLLLLQRSRFKVKERE